MPLSNATIRRRLRKYAHLFIGRDCQYDDGHENAGVEEMLRRLYPVEPASERMKKELRKKKTT